MLNRHDELRSDLTRYMNHVNEATIDIVISAVSRHHQTMSVNETVEWMKRLNRASVCEVKRVPLNSMDKWYFDEEQNLKHETGQFFSIEGVSVRTNKEFMPEWSQPIIIQPEIGLLGILCQKQSGILRFLMQAKIEPGNINNIQLSPTLQATRSNFTRVHDGAYPSFLEYFLNPGKCQVIVDQLQSEQGSRFLKKRNRNMIVEVAPSQEVPIPDNFCWLTLRQIKELIIYDNIVNMDARTVLSCLQVRQMGRSPSRYLRSEGYITEFAQVELIDSLFEFEKASNTIEEIISWLSCLKMNAVLDVNRCGIRALPDWTVNENEISHNEGKFFEIIGVCANIGTREVHAWCQPLIRQIEQGIIGFIVKKINNVAHFLVQAKLEVGNFDLLEMAPTVQCITGSYTEPQYEVPYLEFFTREEKGKILYDSLQSEEGGRFFHEQNRYVVIEVEDDAFPEEINQNYIWMTLGQIKVFIKFNNYFNVEARSLVACISPI